MPITFAQFKQHWWRLKQNDTDDIFDVLAANLTTETKQAILADMDAPVMACRDAYLEEFRVAIREYAGNLPVDDPLRIVIEGAIH